MNREHWKAMLPIITAFVEGKTVQVRDFNGVWEDFHFDGCPKFQRDDLGWRIKPTPRLRPWKPEEVPVGAIVRIKDDPIIRCQIGAVDKLHIVVTGLVTRWGFKDFMNNFELLDGTPCGLEVTE